MINVDFSSKKFLPCHASRELRFKMLTKLVAGVAKNYFPVAASFRTSKCGSYRLADSMVNPAFRRRAYFCARAFDLLTVFYTHALAFLFKLQASGLSISGIPFPRERVNTIPFSRMPFATPLLHALRVSVSLFPRAGGLSITFAILSTPTTQI